MSNQNKELYRFPHIYFTKRNPMQTHEDHMRKLAEEFTEVMMARNDKDLISEILDVLHCCEEILREYPDATVKEAIKQHDVKNRDRGYYNPKD